MIKTWRLISAGLVVLSLTACGGGSKGTPPAIDNGGNAGNLKDKTTFKITVDNAKSVASDAMEVNYSFLDMGAGVGDQVARSLNATSSKGLLKIVQSQVLEAMQDPGKTSSVIQARAAVATIIINCSKGGTRSVNFNDKNGDNIWDVNETLVIEAFNCIEPDSPNSTATTTSNGKMSMTVISKEGDPKIVNSDYKIGLSIEMTGFSISDSLGSTVSNGNMTVLLSHLLSIQTIDVTIPTFSITEGGVAGLLSNIKVTASDNLATLEYGMAISGDVSHSIDGTYHLSTPVTLVGLGTGFPTAGKLRIDAVESSLILTPQADGKNVTLDIDSNGDGITDSSINTTWAALEAA